MAQPTLDERFKKGPPKRAEGDSHGWMTANERRFILWGLKEGWSAARIGRGLGVSDATVRRFRSKFAKDPGLILQLDTFEIFGRAKNDEYRCLVCRDHVLGRRDVERHVLGHFLDESRVDELLSREESTVAESSADIDAPDIAPVQDRADDSSAAASAVDGADENSDFTAASSEGPDQSEDFKRLVAQIGADGTFEEVLKRALSEVSRRRGQPNPDAQPPPAPSIAPETPEPPVREPLTLTQLQERRDARLREVESTGAGQEPEQVEGSEAPGEVSDDAGRVIPLPPAPGAEVESPPSAPADPGQTQGAPAGRQDASEQTREEVQDPTETEKMRLAFERLKAQISDQPASGRRSVEVDSPAQAEEQTIIDGEAAPERPLDTPAGPSDPSGVGAGSYLEPDDVPSEIEIRRAAYERLRAQAAEQDTISPPAPSGRNMEESERARTRRELERLLGGSIPPSQEGPDDTPPPGRNMEESERVRTRRELERLLGESVSLPQEGPDDTPPLTPPDELRDAGSGAPSSTPDAPPTEAEIRRAAFERLRAQAAEEEVSPPPGERRDDEGEGAGRHPDSETVIDEPVPDHSGPVSEGFIREEMFRQARQQAGEESAPSAPLAPEPAPGVGATRGEGEQAPASPISSGVGAAGEDDLDTSDWHAAFERLASERKESSQAPGDEGGADQSPPHEDTPEPGAPAPGLDLEGDPDLPSWQRAFERLSRERAGEDEAETGGDGPSDAVIPGTPQQPQAETPQEASRSEEFDRLRRMAEQEDSSAEAPDPQMNESESDARRAEFERIRGAAQDLNAMPTPPAPPDATPATVERTQQVEAPSETSEAIASLDEEDLFADTDPVTEPAPTEDREGAPVGGQEAPWETPQEAGEDGGPVVVDEPVKGRRVGGVLQLGSRLDVGASLRSAAGRAREVLARISLGAPKETTTLTIEHGYIKLLVTRGREVVDYRIVPASPRFFREGMVSDAPRIAGLLKEAVQDLSGGHKRVIAAVPGYQTNLRRIDVPNVKGMDPNLVIPNEARRTMGIPPNDTRITWHHLPGTVETSSWLVVSATKRSITSISAPAASAGLATTAVELRPFAVARATNEADAVFAWAAADGCDAVVVRDWVPMTYQAAYWGAGLTMESSDLVNRIVEVVESTVDAHDIQNPEMVASRDIPIFVYGSPAAEDAGIAPRVADLLGRETLEPDIPLDLPDGFPLDELIVNVGLSLWDV